MTIAWYGHLKYKNKPLVWVILISWGVALFEYIFQVPANKFGFKENGGPFSLMQLKVTQEAISITVFLIFSILFFKTEKIAWNHIVAFSLIVLAVFFAFIKK